MLRSTNCAQRPSLNLTGYAMLALVTFNRDAGNTGAALEYAEQLSRITPNDRDLTRLTDDLRASLKR